jgi:hypothetical protein
MTATIPPPAPAELGLFARVVGMITAPRATYESVIAKPRPVGILFIAAVAIAIAASAPMFTTTGQQAWLDAMVQGQADAGRPMSPEGAAGLERFVPYLGYVTLAQVFIALPIFALILAALCWVAFNTIMGGTASYKQVLAVVTHSNVPGALGALLGLPITLMQTTLSPGGPFNLGALAPTLDPASTLARFLSVTSVFTIWGLVVMGIGLAVLYRRSSTNVSIALIVVYTIIVFGIMSAFGGGAGR